MDERIREMLDHHDIRNLLARYCHGCDRADEVTMARTYCADSWDDHGPRKMGGLQFALETVQESIETTKMVSHQLGQSLIRVDGENAGAETYFIATVLYATPAGGETLNQLGGRYVDDLVKEDGEWKIKQRICVREWSISFPVESDWLANANFVASRRGQGDEAYRALNSRHLGQLWTSHCKSATS